MRSSRSRARARWSCLCGPGRIASSCEFLIPAGASIPNIWAASSGRSLPPKDRAPVWDSRWCSVSWKLTEAGSKRRARQAREASLPSACRCGKIPQMQSVRDNILEMAEEKILIVDDERLVRWALKHKCEEWGYQALEAEDGASALRIAHAESPDLILLDIRLPDLGGIEVLHRLEG